MEDEQDNVDKPKKENPTVQLVCVIWKLIKSNDIVMGSNMLLLGPNKYCNIMTNHYDHNTTYEPTSIE